MWLLLRALFRVRESVLALLLSYLVVQAYANVGARIMAQTGRSSACGTIVATGAPSALVGHVPTLSWPQKPVLFPQDQPLHTPSFLRHQILSQQPLADK